MPCSQPVCKHSLDSWICHLCVKAHRNACTETTQTLHLRVQDDNACTHTDTSTHTVHTQTHVHTRFLPFSGRTFSRPASSSTFPGMVRIILLQCHPQHIFSTTFCLSLWSAHTQAILLFLSFFKPFTAHLLSCKQSLTKDQTPFRVLAAQQDPQPPPIPLFPLFM